MFGEALFETGIPLPLLGSAVTALATGVGALPALVVRRISERAKDTLMGFSAGVMLAATCFSLVLPALRLHEEAGVSRIGTALMVGAAMLAGGLFLSLCDRFVPHEHFGTGAEGPVAAKRLQRIWLFVLAITLHNFPEGLAVGSGVGSLDSRVAVPILVGIGLQDMPEGFVVAVALVGVGYAARSALGVALLTGVVEAIAALIGYALTVESQAVLPSALAFAGGAMLYVVSDEMIPESHAKEHARDATAGLMVGFVLMMFLDYALG